MKPSTSSSPGSALARAREARLEKPRDPRGWFARMLDVKTPFPDWFLLASLCGMTVVEARRRSKGDLHLYDGIAVCPLTQKRCRVQVHDCRGWASDSLTVVVNDELRLSTWGRAITRALDKCIEVSDLRKWADGGE